MCPDCRLVDCYPELSEADCPSGSILKEGLAYGGCCPACVTYMGEGEEEIPASLDEFYRGDVASTRGGLVEYH